MARIGKVGIGWDGLLKRLTECVSAWRPPTLPKETDYSRALASYLRECLPTDTHVENEYRHLGETLDVYVRYSGVISNDEVFIEMKRRLTRKAELNRLVGQVMSLEPAKNKLIIVLVGDCDAELLGRLHFQFKQYLETGPFITDVPTLSIVQIPECTEALTTAAGDKR